MFIQRMKETQTTKIIFTGTRTDPQIYKYEKDLVNLLRTSLPGVHISLHTNGVNALQKLDTFNLYDSCTISFNSFNPATYSKLHGTKVIPDLQAIVSKAKMPVKLSCILTEDNKDEVEDYIKTARALGVRRIAFRHIYGKTKFSVPLFSKSAPVSHHCSNPVYDFDGVQATHWIFDSTSGKSLNLFSDGTISEEYLLSKAPSTQKAVEALDAVGSQSSDSVSDFAQETFTSNEVSV